MTRRVAIVRGPHQGQVLEHDLAAGTTFLRPWRAGRGETLGLAVYRIFSFSRALGTDRDRADLYAAEWCAEHDAFRDHCAHAPPAPTRRWARFGPRFDRTKLAPDAPGSRESKWHLLLRADQRQEPWLTACRIIVYGPIIEACAHATPTPVGVPMCRRCKATAGVQERVPTGIVA